MAKGHRSGDCFVSRFCVDPTKREEFLLAFNNFVEDVEQWYDLDVVFL